MTEKDKALIERAYRFHKSQWFEVNDLIEQAETDEARERLIRIRRMLVWMDKNPPETVL